MVAVGPLPCMMKVLVLFSTNARVEIMNAVGLLVGRSLTWNHNMQWYPFHALAVCLIFVDVDGCECVFRSWHGKALQ